jgi:hypothetical protein
MIKTPLALRLPDGDRIGYSINISESGVWASFDRGLDLWVEGTLSATFGERDVNFGVRVVRSDGHEAGLIFHGLSDEDRVLIKTFIDQSKGELCPDG